MLSDTKTRECTEGATATVQAKYGDSCSVNQVDPDPMYLTSFGNGSTGPLALPCSRDDALVDNGAAAPKSCLSPMEMRTLTAADGLLPNGKTSKVTMHIVDQLPLWFCLTKKIKFRTTNQYATDCSSFWKLNVLETKSRQTPVFDPGGSTGHLRACPFWGARRALLCGEVVRLGAGWYPRLQPFLADG